MSTPQLITGQVLEIEEDVTEKACLDSGFDRGLGLPVRNGAYFDLCASPFRLVRQVDAFPLPRSQGWRGLAEMKWLSRPFPFALGTGALQDADQVLGWLQGNDRWQRHDSGFYAADVISLELLDPPEPCARLFRAEGRAELEKAASLMFGEQLRLHGPLAAHRMVFPQSIGVHSDAPEEGDETHRIVILLCDHWARPQGGHFILLGNETPRYAQAIIPHSHNTVLAFRLTSQSYHAITTVMAGTRFSIVASFRTA